jgi:DNA-binding transcriptional regulator YbjK
MASNPARRAALADAAITVLAAEGARHLTHRAVDRAAGEPSGTASNYFRTRDALYDAMGERIYERLAPQPDVLASVADVPPSRARLVRLIVDIVEKIVAEPQLTVALLELRLEATRRPAVQHALTRLLRDGFDADLAFHRAAKLDGDRDELVLLHLAINGLVLDQLTTPDALGISDPRAVAEQLVERLVPR